MAGIKLVGINKLTAKLEKNMDMEAAKRVVKHNGAQMQAQAQRNAPVDTGTLKRSIVLDITDGGMTAESVATADYAGYVEWGTRFQEPQLYMGDAWVKQGEKFRRDMKKLAR